MALQMFELERGIHIVGENSQVGVHHLFGSGVPGSAAQEDDAEVGSIYTDTTTGFIYYKITSGSGTDKWEQAARGPDVDDLITLSGVVANSTNLGTFTGVTIPDSSTVKSALQSLETAVEAITVSGSSSAITTAVTVDSVLVDNVGAVEWYLQVTLDSDPSRKLVEKIHAAHNGTASADATSADYTVFGKLQIGNNFNLTVSIDVNGSAGSQVMRLRVAATGAVTAKFIRRVIA